VVEREAVVGVDGLGDVAGEPEPLVQPGRDSQLQDADQLGQHRRTANARIPRPSDLMLSCVNFYQQQAPHPRIRAVKPRKMAGQRNVTPRADDPWRRHAGRRAG
jgi:hypothetical protein